MIYFTIECIFNFLIFQVAATANIDALKEPRGFIKFIQVVSNLATTTLYIHVLLVPVIRNVNVRICLLIEGMLYINVVESDRLIFKYQLTVDDFCHSKLLYLHIGGFVELITQHYLYIDM